LAPIVVSGRQLGRKGRLIARVRWETLRRGTTMKVPSLRFFTTGVCALALTACGDDGSSLTGATAGMTAGPTSAPSTDSTPGTTSGSNSNSDSDPTESPTGGMSVGETEATTGTTGDPTEGLTTTEAVTEPVPECGNGAVEGDEQC